MSKNYGWGSRDMSYAGRLALQDTNASFSTVATHIERFDKFKEFAKENGVARFERVDQELVKEYGKMLAAAVDNGEKEPAYAQNLVSSINSVMKAVTRGEWKSVSPTKECGIAQRSNVRTESTPDREQANKAIQELKNQGFERQAAVASLALDLGLRGKEASLLDAKSALKQAENQGKVSIQYGTKGGRERELKIQNERQIETLRAAAETQAEARAVMPPDQNWKQWGNAGLSAGRETLHAACGGTYHDLRATYAVERYESLTGNTAPCNGGKIEDRQLDREARQTIAEELGHGRIGVVSAYVGGRT